MAATKTFQTQFRIGATWTGGPAVAKAQSSLGGLARHAQRATTHVRGMAASVFKGMAAYGLASKAISSFTEILAKSISAATEAQEAHDALRLSIARNAKNYRNLMGKSVQEVTASVEESTQALIKA